MSTQAMGSLGSEFTYEFPTLKISVFQMFVCFTYSKSQRFISMDGCHPAPLADCRQAPRYRIPVMGVLPKLFHIIPLLRSD